MNAYTEFAKQNYTTYGFFTDEEFKKDLKIVSNIRRMLIELVGGRIYNLRLITNHFICLSNVFLRSAIPELLKHKIDEYYHEIANAFLKFLNLPLIDTSNIEETLLHDIKEEFSNENTTPTCI